MNNVENNVEQTDEFDLDAPELREALIAQNGLSQADVARIGTTMNELGVSFFHAALQLELATREDVAQLIRHERAAKPQGGLFENALRRMSQRQDLVVRQGIAKPSIELLRSQQNDAARGEKLRALRTELMLLNDSAQRGNVIAFVSPGRGEGRSRLCADLAMMFAQLGRRTLLVDADLRHPSQHALFCADNQWGLAEALANGDTPYLYGVQGLPDLALITAGAQSANPLELVSHSRFARLIATIRRQYDFILLDTPAMTPYSDAMQIASAAERVVTVSRAAVTSLQSMKEMLGRLAVTNSKILGAVINRF
jgi:protein-tyrosine kinase